MTIDNLISKYGKITVKGLDYVLLQNAYIGGTLFRPCFFSNAIVPAYGPNKNGLFRVFEISWLPRQEWLDGDREDEGDACDWNNPCEICPDSVIEYDLSEGIFC